MARLDSLTKRLYGANIKLKSERHKLVAMIQGAEGREPRRALACRTKQIARGLSNALQPGLHRLGYHGDITVDEER